MSLEETKSDEIELDGGQRPAGSEVIKFRRQVATALPKEIVFKSTET